MPKLKLVQATEPNGIWKRLRGSWETQMTHHKAPTDWAAPYLDHAEKIVHEEASDHRYGIFVACGDRGGRSSAPYEGFVHINFKLPKTSGAEIRLIWNRLAPRFQFEDLREHVSEIQATFLIGALKLSEDNPRNPPVKMFLGNPIDIAFGRQFALLAPYISGMKLEAKVRGNWLHVSRQP